MNPTGPRSKDAAAMPVTFDNYPHPEDFMRDGGLPGVEYLFCHTNNGPRAQSEGWGMIRDVPQFTIRGVPAQLMGRGSPSPTGRPGASRCLYKIDKDLVIAVGLPCPTTGPEKVFTPTDPSPGREATTALATTASAAPITTATTEAPAPTRSHLAAPPSSAPVPTSKPPKAVSTQ